MIMVVLFTAIFSTISVIEDRKEGFLQAVLVAPVARSTVVLGKILGGTTLALGQALLLLAAAPFLGLHLGIGDLVLIVAIIFVVAFALTTLGFLIAWKMESTQGFHAIMNLVLIPDVAAVGRVLPGVGASGWLRACDVREPADVRRRGAATRALHRQSVGADVPTLAISIFVTCGFAVLTFLAALAHIASAGRRVGMSSLASPAGAAVAAAPRRSADAPARSSACCSRSRPQVDLARRPAPAGARRAAGPRDRPRLLAHRGIGAGRSRWPTSRAKPWVVDLVFTHCGGICPTMTAAMSKLVQSSSALPAQFVSISVDPKNDTPEVLTAYARALPGGPTRWLFLTGDERDPQARDRRAQLPLADGDPAQGEDAILHSQRSCSSTHSRACAARTTSAIRRRCSACAATSSV